MACNTHEEMRNEYKIFSGKPQSGRPLENLAVDGRVILKLTLKERGGG
jgi:hypothetical protein